MNPVIIIPTYICNSQTPKDAGVVDTYDHMNPISRDGDLVRCLSSLRDKGIEAPVAILVVAEKGIEKQAEEKVRDQAAHYPELEISVVACTEESALHERMRNLGLEEFVDGVTLRGYGASKNLGLVYAASMGYTEAVFIDDDEVVEDDSFMEKACYGLGMLTKRGVPILIKTGFYLDKNGSYKSRAHSNWYDRFWQQHKGFDKWIEKAMHGPRLSASNTAYAGLLAIHREAFRRVSFDPWIARGEDLDFLLDVRMYGSEVWFDNMWAIRHLPPAVSKQEARRFAQDIYRWFYEKRKLEFSSTQIDLLKIQYRNLEPYPGPFLESSIKFNVLATALLRGIGRKGQHNDYFNAALLARRGAKVYAKENCANYFSFQRMWPEVVAMLEEDVQLKGVFGNAAVVPMTEEQIEMADSRRIEAQILGSVYRESGRNDGENPDELHGSPESAFNVESNAADGIARRSGFGEVLRGYTERKNIDAAAPEPAAIHVPADAPGVAPAAPEPAVTRVPGADGTGGDVGTSDEQTRG